MVRIPFLSSVLLLALFSLSSSEGLCEKYQDMSMEQAMEARSKEQLAQTPKKKMLLLMKKI